MMRDSPAAKTAHAYHVIGGKTQHCLPSEFRFGQTSHRGDPTNRLFNALTHLLGALQCCANPAYAHRSGLIRECPQGIPIKLKPHGGYCALDAIRAFLVSGGLLEPHHNAPRRPGDVSVDDADPRLAMQLLGRKVKRNVATTCPDHWRWQKHNPQSYI